ncbi:tRNA (N6-threonylcarbamoyladenosine(37)-N6)-methyltransferase TrmO [Bacillus sp. AFS002410]|uniref:tRNA (N6-threonylcarbamoyladenosine(37)-N6)-methyltransferase TrmO n=1 Tax=Bacillus sp. AFS002410 TaxID=2033481 RepID=UPI000BEF611E|nr:tRNA (N6-threonylcarbamoyladenosine(37)-N6)-methyltransferase TrmO [Bacillus sp. AFS002410]PEJ54362.1 tRNA (N6-threonylcarbamoyladenosine(37)-N6)-methyltransferase TrmO [Bacillus sp. AFS002410]
MSFAIQPIAFVKNSRKEIEDDYWGSIVSEIELVDELNEEAFSGISDFSHLEIIFYFDKVTDEMIQYNARHPRNNTKYPKVGIFAQRGKNRPNKLGLTTVELLKHNGRILTVKGLDAIDSTPIIDIKPIMREFLPKGEIKQAEWSKYLMKKYW